MLLIGRSGTGKTFLLNSISEALGLEHRHYNASLISFDDLVGFPYPDEAKASVRFLETPATVWGAESVLIDEISRCKPEHQNRLFSLVHERKIQGLSLTKLRYRWAAMNPCTTDQSAGEEYLGAEPLDAALADRFAVILEVGDWDALSDADRRLVANPAGEGRQARRWRPAEGGARRSGRRPLRDHSTSCPAPIVDYVCAVTTALRDGGIRLSPRRARLITRTLLAATIVEGITPDALGTARVRRAVPRPSSTRAFRSARGAPRPTPTRWPPRIAWPGTRRCRRGGTGGCTTFTWNGRSIARRGCCSSACPDPDTGTLAVEQLLANEPKERAAAFALAAYPAAVAGRLPDRRRGRERSRPLRAADCSRWTARSAGRSVCPTATSTHPELARFAPVLAASAPRAASARQQLLYFCIVNNLTVANPREFEQEFHRCVQVFGDGRTA